MSKRDKKGRFKVLHKVVNNKKKCSVCSKNLPLESFQFLNKNNPNSIHKIGTRRARCKNCFNIYRKNKWRKNEKNKLKEKNYREDNKYKQSKRIKLWKKQNKERVKKTNSSRSKIRRLTDKSFKIRSNLSRRINHALTNHFKDKKIKKNIKTLDLLGCSVEKLIKHLEKKFHKGMDWKNYGKWEIDHIIPCAKFNLEHLDQQKICFNYKNLQPLWKIDNIKKSDKI